MRTIIFSAQNTQFNTHIYQNSQELINAAISRDIAKVNKLLTPGPNGILQVNVNQADNHGRTALYWAACLGHDEVVKALLALKDSRGNLLVDVNKADNYGQAALYWAAGNGRTEVVKLLLALKDSRGNPLVDVNKADNYGQTALHLAASNGRTEVVKALLALKDSCGNLLVDVKKANNYGRTAFYLAAGNNHDEIVEDLLGLKDTSGNLLVDVNKADNDWCTPLYRAARHDHTQIVKDLLALKDTNGNPAVDVNVIPNSAETVMDFYEKNPEMLRLIRACGGMQKRAGAAEYPLRQANEHTQNVHAWYDVKCADANVSVLLEIEESIQGTRKDAYKQFNSYVSKQIQAICQAPKGSKLSKRLIPEEYLRVASHESASGHLETGLQRLGEMGIPGDFYAYTYTPPEGGNAEQVETVLKSIEDMPGLVGLMWKVLHDVVFIKSTLPKSGRTDADAQAYIKTLEEGFIHQILLAEVEYNASSPACAKGLGSKIIHGILESINGERFTKRNVIIDEYMGKKRMLRGVHGILSEDISTLIPIITESMLRQAYDQKGLYPTKFKQLCEYLSSIRYANLMNDTDPDYAKNHGIRQHIIGFANNYLYDNFPQGYPRTTPNENDFIAIEDNFAPRLPWNDVIEDLVALCNAQASVDERKKEKLAFIGEFLAAVREKKDLPSAPFQFDTEWLGKYNHECKRLLDANTDNEKDFQYALLDAMTAGLANRYNVVQNVDRPKVGEYTLSERDHALSPTVHYKSRPQAQVQAQSSSQNRSGISPPRNGMFVGELAWLFGQFSLGPSVVVTADHLSPHQSPMTHYYRGLRAALPRVLGVYPGRSTNSLSTAENMNSVLVKHTDPANPNHTIFTRKRKC